MFWLNRWYWLAVAAGLVALYAFSLVFKFVVVPIRLHKKHRTMRRPRYEPTRAEELTPEIRDFMGTLVPQFAAEGFEVAANVLVVEDEGKEERVFTTLPVCAGLVHRGTGDTASII